jgi:hypothetical protein
MAESRAQEQSPPLSQAAAYYRELLTPVLRGRRFVLIGGPLVGLGGLGAQLCALGAEKPFLLGSGVGTGAPPDPRAAECFSLDLRVSTLSAEFRAVAAALRDPSPALVSALDRWDPERRAQVAGLIVLGEVPGVAGRPRYARPPAAWAALEDKCAVEALWEAAGIPRAPSRVVDARAAPLLAAARDLDRGAGAVLAGDAREGVHGGAEGLRWVREAAEVREAAAFFAPRCDRVRVMPFLEGVPCSIHGIVLPDFVAALRPIELVTLRRPADARLLYAGLGTTWDPPAADREAMRALARRLGELLRERVAFRGPFTVDGVLTAEGFRPTELNPRFGAGLGLLAGAMPALPLAPLMLAAAEGEDLDYRPAWLEEVVVAEADRRRAGRGARWLEVVREDSVERDLVEEPGGGYRRARPGEEPHATLVHGPGSLGSFLSFAPRPDRLRPGRLLAPVVVQGLAAADRELGTGIGPLETAREMRPATGGVAV